MSALSNRIKALTLEKINFQNDEAETRVKALHEKALALDTTTDELELLLAGDVDQEDTAHALVDLADLVDDANLSPDQRTQLDGIVNRLVKNGSDEQKTKVKELFSNTLDYFLYVKDFDTYMDGVLNTEEGDGE